MGRGGPPLDAGFNGVYSDTILAFEFFEEMAGLDAQVETLGHSPTVTAAAVASVTLDCYNPRRTL